MAAFIAPALAPLATAMRSPGSSSSRTAAAAKAKSTAHLTFANKDETGVQNASGVVRYHGSAADLSFTVGSGAQPVRMIVVNGVAYLSFGPKVKGKTWARIAPGGKDPLSRTMGPLINLMSSSLDVNSQLTSVRDAKIVSAEPTHLDGVPVVKYLVTTSERDLVAQLTRFRLPPEAIKQLSARFKGAHGESVMYVDASDLVLRAENSVIGGAVAQTTTVTYSHWGEPVSITPPPASDVIDSSALGV
jgi:hypothetical protein